MNEQTPPPGRRRRRANRPRTGEPDDRPAERESSAQAPAAPPASAQPSARANPGPRPRRGRGRDGGPDLERGLRDLVGAGPSQLGVSGALRARDVDQPTPQELAEAARDVAIIRRSWQPPT